MIGSPENNFQTMQPPQTMPQPRNVMLGNAMQNMPKPPMQPRQPMQSMPQAPSMMPPNQYGNPTPQMPMGMQPQSNAGYNLQPQIPNMQSPQSMGQGQNPFGVGLARPMPQATQVS